MRQWDDSLSVDVAVLDEQHRFLIALINKLGLALKLGRKLDVLEELTGQLANYAIVHFEAEEQLMRDCKFAGYEDHYAKHAEFKRKLVTFHQKTTAGDVLAITEFAIYLNNWVVDHIQTVDQAYKAAFKEHGLK